MSTTRRPTLDDQDLDTFDAAFADAFDSADVDQLAALLAQAECNVAMAQHAEVVS